MSNPEDYAVGWICAISTEHVAAQSFLDEKHGAPSSVAKHDNNDYTLGRIGEHNVVIAVLPDGEYGIASAASVARDMLHSFPNVRIGLMVGIGGGAPSPSHDIRLGDVVVSAPRGGIGGVFQYDFGKTIQNQSFQTTGFLNQPPTVLRTAMAGLKSEYESEGHQFEATIRSVLDKKPRLRKKYSRPDQTSDRLYQSNIVHPVDSAESCKIVCGSDQSTLVPRRDREEDQDNPAVHHGLIASANQLMKDASMRDALAAEMDVLCFEMEAAGLMNQFPCLVIRGICDYADSHKNKEWQGYAAMTAAAYAKDLLYRIPPNKVEAEQKIKDALSQVVKTVDYLKSEWESRKDLEILDWITPYNYGPQHSDYFNRRQPGTGQWLLQSWEYRLWLVESNQTLFCPGIPAAGKTILTAIVVEDLRFRTSNDADAALAYIYCNFKRQHEQGIEDLIASLLKQLCRKRSCLPDAIIQLHEWHEKEETRPSLDDLVGALRTVAAMYSQVFVVIDALDECAASNHTRSRLLSYISSLRTSTAVSLFATSRHIPDVEKEFKGSLKREALALEEDMHRYLAAHMKYLPSFLSNLDELKEDIKTQIVQAAQGMFLLVHLHLDSLKGATSMTEVKSTLERLKPRKYAQEGHDGLQTALEQAYDEAMDRIDRQSPDQQRLGRNALEWITCAKRPLTQLELQHALAVNLGDTSLDADNLRGVEDIISVCAGLVTIDEESNVIRLVHYTTQEYFDRMKDKMFPDVEERITVVCCTYLSNIPRSVVHHPDEGEEALLEANPLYDYAGKNWGHHARLMPGIPLSIQEFMTCQTTIEAAAEALNYSPGWVDGRKHYPKPGDRLHPNSWESRRSDPWRWNGIHLAALFGICQAVDFLLHDKQDLGLRDKHQRTPLIYAVENRHHDIVRLLIEKGAVIDVEDLYRRTPLIYAIEEDQESMVRMLHEMGARDFEVCPPSRSDRLSYAVLHSTEGIMRTFVENCSRGEKDGFGRMLLYDAVRGGHADYIRLLLEKGNDLFIEVLETLENLDEVLGESTEEMFTHDESNETYNGSIKRRAKVRENHSRVVDLALRRGLIRLGKRDRERLLFLAAGNGRIDFVQLLLQQGISIRSRGRRSRTALSYAARGGHEVIVQLLLEQSLEVDARDRHGRTPLSLAADSKEDCTAAIWLLLNGGAEIDARDSGGSTPLMRACAASMSDHRYNTIHLLLKRGADINARDRDGNTPLMQACAIYGSDDRYGTIELLLHRGAAIEARDHEGKTALMKAAHRSYVWLLLEMGAMIEATDNSGRTALMHAVYNFRKRVVDELLYKGAAADARDDDGNTALSSVFEARPLGEDLDDIIRLLLEGGASANKRDRSGRTILMKAAARGSTSSVKLLVRYGAVVEVKDYLGQTALRHALDKDEYDAAEELLTAGADIEVKDNSGKAALHHAVSVGQYHHGLEFLLDKGAEINARDDWGQTALMYAVDSKCTQCTRVLLDRDAAIEEMDDLGQTALMHAAQGGDLIFMEMLLDAGADLEAKDNDGKSVLFHAVKSTQNPLGAIELLLDRGAALDARALSYAMRHRKKSLIAQLLRAKWKSAS